MQLTLPFTAPGHTAADPECPFCPGDEDKDWKTYKGDTNDSEILRRLMNNPVKLTDGNNQPGARPKDGKEGRQAPDDRRPVYTAKTSVEGPYIYKHDVFGEYSNEAHHAISGNQILSGHNIEKLILSTGNSGKLEKDTGYSVNNCANGVCLPSYPSKYRGPNARPAWSVVATDKKEWAAWLPMEAGKGQVHIGEHDHPGDPDDVKVAPIHHNSYPKQARAYLTDLYLVSVFRWSRECLLCAEENGTVKDPLPPPYRINGRLDGVSARLIHHVRNVPYIGWIYFISEYAMRLHYSKCKHPKSRNA